MTEDDGRRAELVRALAAVRARIADACAAADRDPRAVRLIAVTKTYPAADVETLARLGAHDIGESKDQEARAKIADLPDLDVRWHFIGRLQSRKCRSVASYASAVHSVDRVELIDKLADGARRAERDKLEVFLQVSLDDDPGRGGASASELEPLADAVASHDVLRLRGIMAIAPIDAEPAAAYARLAELSARLRRAHPDADAISAGMSGDLDAAIAHGSTHVRVGTALLGRRPPTFG